MKYEYYREGTGSGAMVIRAEPENHWDVRELDLHPWVPGWGLEAARRPHICDECPKRGSQLIWPRDFGEQ